MKKQLLRLVLFTACICLMLLAGPHKLFAQGKPPVVQFSGIVISAADSGSVIPGVHIYVPKAGRGTTSNVLGYFSMPVLVGDSVVVSAVGFEKQHFIIPNNKGDQLTVVVEMSQDTAYLPEIAVFPYPTEEMFKAAILALELPNQEEIDYMKKNLSPDVLAYMMSNTPMDGNENYKFYTQQQLMQQYYGNSVRTNPFFNPLNWARFIQSIKRGDFKQK